MKTRKAKCNDCGKTGNAVNHNGRGFRCRFCWSDNVVLKPLPKPKPAPKNPDPDS